MDTALTNHRQRKEWLQIVRFWHNSKFVLRNLRHSVWSKALHWLIMRNVQMASHFVFIHGSTDNDVLRFSMSRTKHRVKKLSFVSRHFPRNDEDNDLRHIYYPNVNITSITGLAGMIFLESLCLRGTQIQDSDMEILRGFVHLRELDISHISITDEGLRQLRGLVQLQYLNLFCCKEITDAGFSHLGGLTNMEKLVLRQTNVTDAGLACLSEMTNLRYLDLQQTKITNNPFSIKTLHRMMNKLQYFNISRTRIPMIDYIHCGSDLHTLYLPHGITNSCLPKTLHTLCAISSEITNDGCEQMATLTNLQHLDLRNSIISDAGDAGLAFLTGLTNLRYLSLDGIMDQLTNVGLDHLSGLIHLRHLEIGDTGITEIQHLRNMVELEVLILYNTLIHEGELTQLRGFLNLRELNISDIETVTDAVFEHLQELTKLEILSFCHTKITDRGLEMFLLQDARILIRDLTLSQTHITDAGLEHVGGLINLKNLDISLNIAITDIGARHLRGLIKMENLNITGTKITNRGLIHFREMVFLNQLFCGPPITEDGFQEYLLGYVRPWNIDWFNPGVPS